MTTDTMRVYELAKELGISNKEVIEALNKKLGVVVKSHSSALSKTHANKLKEVLNPSADKKTAKKPKAFIVKKSKAKAEKVEKTETAEVKQEEKKGEAEDSKSKTPDMRSLLEYNNQNSQKRRAEIQAAKATEAAKKAKIADEKTAVKKQDTAKKIDFRENYKRGSNFKNSRTPDKVGAKKPADSDKDSAKKPQDKGTPRQPVKRHIISQDIYDSKSSSGKRKGNKSKEKQYKSKEEQQELISLEKAISQKHKKKSKKDEAEEQAITKVVIDQVLTVGELADKIQKSSAEIVRFLMMEGVLATVNQVIDIKTQKKVCESFELEVLEEDVDAYIQEEIEKEEKLNEIKNVDEKLLKSRAPVVSIMGHVDHGKTTLLDSIRASKHKIVSTEVGGITQSIGAYSVHLDDKKIVFIDTPGHEAFTEMRARGAKSTDIAILVVAADDGIMPQTIEAINHAKAAEVPIIVAVNKIDKPDADADKILQQLTEHGLVPEAWGGDTVCVKVSALQGTGIDELLEYILLLAEVQNFKANPTAMATGIIIEANLDKGKGPVATLLVQNGTLKESDCVVVGKVCGKVRALLSDSGERVKKAGPSTPVEILGLSEVPQAGDVFEVVKNEKAMKALAQERKESDRASRLEAMMPAHVRNDVVGEDEEIQNLNLIIKASTNGSAEAVAQGIRQLESKEIITKIVHVGVGDISEADVMLASASNAIILGFGVKDDLNAQLTAEKEGVTIKKYDIIYQVLEDIEKTMLNLLQPEIKEVVLGVAEVRQIFTVGKTAKIAGCYVLEGKVIRNSDAVVIRDGEEIFKGQINQLKRFKDDAKEVAQGFECGISFDKFNDIQEGDLIQVKTTEEIERQVLV